MTTANIVTVAEGASTKARPGRATSRRQATVMLRNAALVAGGTLALAAGAWIEVPITPVPMTMQTFVVVLLGALYGWRFATLTVLAYLCEAALGLPVLAGGKSGLQAFAGPTAGYLFAFPLAAALVGVLTERGWAGRSLARSFSVMLLAHALILMGGLAWLATVIGLGWERAITVGIMPFVVGTLLKSALAAVSFRAVALVGCSPSLWSRS